MARRAAKVDRNQNEIVDAFRKFGCSVLLLHTVGRGCPDICVGKNKKSVLPDIQIRYNSEILIQVSRYGKDLFGMRECN